MPCCFFDASMAPAMSSLARRAWRSRMNGHRGDAAAGLAQREHALDGERDDHQRQRDQDRDERAAGADVLGQEELVDHERDGKRGDDDDREEDGVVLHDANAGRVRAAERAAGERVAGRPESAAGREATEPADPRAPPVKTLPSGPVDFSTRAPRPFPRRADSPLSAGSPARPPGDEVAWRARPRLCPCPRSAASASTAAPAPARARRTPRPRTRSGRSSRARASGSSPAAAASA